MRIPQCICITMVSLQIQSRFWPIFHFFLIFRIFNSVQGFLDFFFFHFFAFFLNFFQFFCFRNLSYFVCFPQFSIFRFTRIFRIFFFFTFFYVRKDGNDNEGNSEVIIVYIIMKVIIMLSRFYFIGEYWRKLVKFKSCSLRLFW